MVDYIKVLALIYLRKFNPIPRNQSKFSMTYSLHILTAPIQNDFLISKIYKMKIDSSSPFNSIFIEAP